jgi:hypothetical protein
MVLGKGKGLEYILVLDAVNLVIIHRLARVKNNVQMV